MVQLMVSFRGTTVPEDLLRLVQQGDVGAICLFTFNVESPAQLRTLTQSIYDAAKSGNQPTPIIGIDQEGGQLIAIRGGATELPGNMALGAARSPALAEQAGRILGRELLAMGVNMNFAPSLDVNVNPFNPVIGIRSFGDDPDQVAELGAAQIRGMQAEGVIATAKHFPGHGDTAVDSHLGVPVVAHDLPRLQEVEMAPFRRAITEDVAAIMSSHIQYDAIDPELVANISPRILTDLLRRELGYVGLIVTDAMDMHAVASLGTDPSIRGALNAGADLVMLGHVVDQVGLVGRMKALFNEASIARIRHAQKKLPTQLPDLTVVGAEEHLT
ncbi:MAG: beta-N-acetylhexosaminidase, partial [Anaerolineae bacterium]|nr:beta-N-acetylhexosaminidase [Anaerolineae bacterium]